MTNKSSVSTRSRLSFAARKAISNKGIHSSGMNSLKLKKQIQKATQNPTSISARIKKRRFDTLSITSQTTANSDNESQSESLAKKVIKSVQRLKKPISKGISTRKVQRAVAKAIISKGKKSVKKAKAVSTKKAKEIHDVDLHCPIDYKVKVYSDHGYAYDKMLNQSNMDANNNKFYVIQLLQDKTNSTKFWVWNRWGRVGVDGQNSLKGPMTLVNAKDEFKKKLNDKTNKGNYIEVKIDHGESNSRVAAGLKKINASSKPMSNEVRELVKLIFDENMLNIQLKSTGYDSRKMPLGKLSQQAINDGYKILAALMKGLKEGKDIEFCKDLSSQFYSIIPHDFGFQKMINFILDTEDKIKEKLKMLQTLSELQVATQTNEANSKSTDKVQANYDALDCTLDYVKEGSHEFDTIKKFFNNTKGYYNNLKIMDVYKVEKKKTFKDNLDNRMLLWHGSGIGNYVGILSQGLRIAPPEAPASGYLLGKGLYFADLLEKSAGYVGTNQKNEGLVLLVDVALGDMNKLYNHSYSAGNLPAGKNSVKCCGSKEPPKESWVNLDKSNVPAGKPVNTNLSRSVCHNEYVVYNTDQANFRYIIKVKY